MSCSSNAPHSSQNVLGQKGLNKIYVYLAMDHLLIRVKIRYKNSKLVTFSCLLLRLNVFSQYRSI